MFTQQGSITYRDALKDQWVGLTLVFMFSGMVNILMLTGSIYMLQVYDRVLTSGSIVTLIGLFTIVLILYVFLGTFDFLRQRMLSRISVRLDLRLGKHSFRSWLKSESKSSTQDAEPLQRLGALRQFLASPAAVSLCDLPFVPIFVVVMFMIHHWLGAMILIGAGLAVLVALVGRLLTSDWQEQASQESRALQSFTEQTHRSCEAIAAMRMQEQISDRWVDMQKSCLALQQRATNPAEIISTVSKTLRLGLQSAILTVGAVLVLQDQISAGMIIASSILSNRALAPIDQVISQWRVIGQALNAHRVLRAFFDAPKSYAAPIDLPPLSGDLTVVSLTKYAPRIGINPANPLMMNVTFELQAGDGLGVIGKSAAGKSVLARLLVGAWTPDRGMVRLGGSTLDKWPPDIAGRAIGYLPQNMAILPGTIRQNIARFCSHATDLEVIAAAKLAGIHDFILDLPNEYASNVEGLASTPLSGGQIQLIGLARAILFSPKLVVLDEPNANLDGEGDVALERAIHALRAAGSIVIVMAHRPSAVAGMNKIMVMEQGRIVRFDKKETILGPSHPSSIITAVRKLDERPLTVQDTHHPSARRSLS